MIQLQFRIYADPEGHTIPMRIEVDKLPREDATQFERDFVTVVEHLVARAIVKAARDAGMTMQIDKIEEVTP